MIEYIILAVILIISVLIINSWVKAYNQFHRWKESINRKFADINILMQQRLVMIDTLAQVVNKYGTHEHDSFKEVTEARSRWTKDTPSGNLNDKVQQAQDIENNFLKIQAIFEKYPELKANSMYQSLMGNESVSNIETRFRNAAEEYNVSVEKYNYVVRKFPTSFIASAHNFKTLDYFVFEKVTYETRNFFKVKDTDATVA